MKLPVGILMEAVTEVVVGAVEQQLHAFQEKVFVDILLDKELKKRSEAGKFHYAQLQNTALAPDIQDTVTGIIKILEYYIVKNQMITGCMYL